MWEGDNDDEDEDEAAIGLQNTILPSLNKKIRSELLRQSTLTNRFRGSGAARAAEADFKAYATRYKLPITRRRLWRLTLVIPLIGVPLCALGGWPATFVVARSVLPSVASGGAFILCSHRRTRPYWETTVTVCVVLVCNSILWADWARSSEIATWDIGQKDEHSLWQLIWYFTISLVSSLFFALDLVYVLQARDLPMISP